MSLILYSEILFRGGVIGISTGFEKVIKGVTGVGRDSYTPLQINNASSHRIYSAERCIFYVSIYMTVKFL